MYCFQHCFICRPSYSSGLLQRFHWQFKRTTVKLIHIRLNLIIVNDEVLQKCMIFIAKMIFFASSYEPFAVQTQNILSSQPFLPTPPPHPTMLHAIAQLE
jgi:hypothetical protein